MKTEERKVNVDPRISLNKLGEFLTTNPSRRRRILMDQKYPSEFIVTRYNDAENAIVTYLYDNKNDVTILDNALSEIEAKRAKTDWEIHTKSLNYDAIDSFYDIAEQLDFTKYRIEKNAKSESVSLLIEGVQISVRPEILIYKEKGDDKSIGAAKVYFSKTYNLNDEAGEYIASFVMEYLKQMKQDYTVNNKICNVIDVFNQKIFTAPLSYKRRMLDIKAACQEIAAIWNSL